MANSDGTLYGVDPIRSIISMLRDSSALRAEKSKQIATRD
jgi:hypothetical protein